MKKAKKLNKRTQRTILSILVILFFAIVLKCLLSNTFELMTNTPFKFAITFKTENPDIDPEDLTFMYRKNEGDEYITGKTTIDGDDSKIEFSETEAPTGDYYITIMSINPVLNNLLVNKKLIVENKVYTPTLNDITVKMDPGEFKLELRDG